MYRCEFRFARLAFRFSDFGQDGMATFFLLSERMTTLSSAKALRQGGFLDDYVWVKLETVALYRTYKSISNLIESVHGRAAASRPPVDLIGEI